MKKLILIMLGMFLISLVSAEINEYAPVKQFDCVNIKQVCASCTYVKVTVSYPNSTLAISNQAMTDSGGGVWTYNFCATEQLGRYDVNGEGDLEGTSTGFDVLFFEVTPSGLQGTFGFYILVILLSIGVIVLGYYVKDAWIVMLGSFGLVLFGLYILFFGLAGIKDATYTWGLGIIILMLGGYFGIKAGLEKIDNEL